MEQGEDFNIAESSKYNDSDNLLEEFEELINNISLSIVKENLLEEIKILQDNVSRDLESSVKETQHSISQAKADFLESLKLGLEKIDTAAAGAHILATEVIKNFEEYISMALTRFESGVNENVDHITSAIQIAVKDSATTVDNTIDIMDLLNSDISGLNSQVEKLNTSIKDYVNIIDKLSASNLFAEFQNFKKAIDDKLMQIQKGIKENGEATDNGIKKVYEDLRDSITKFEDNMNGISQSFNSTIQLIYKSIQNLDYSSRQYITKITEIDDGVRKTSKMITDLNKNIAENAKKSENKLVVLENVFTKRMAYIESRLAQNKEINDKRYKIVTNILWAAIILLVIVIIRG